MRSVPPVQSPQKDVHGGLSWLEMSAQSRNQHRSHGEVGASLLVKATLQK